MIYSLLALLTAVTAIYQRDVATNLTYIEGEYIVVFAPHVDEGRRALHMSNLEGVELMHEYSIGGHFNGYAGKMDASKIDTLMATGDVAYVEQNKQVHALTPAFEAKKNLCLQDTNVGSWGLTRVNQRQLNLDGTFAFKPNDGEDVNVYVIDTGIFLDHEDFEGRAIFGVDTADNPPNPIDGNGHGTHVAGTVMGARYGVAKKATAYAVKVLGTNGFGTNAGVIAGVDWSVQHFQKSGNKKGIGNMSLGGGRSAATDAAVNAAVKSGMPMAVAAGNDGQIPWNSDACDHSPAAATDVITVGSTDPADRRSPFSNFGVCVDVFAPGSDITAPWIGGVTATTTISGTSMASPHVAGVLAQYWSQHPELDYQQVERDVMNMVSEGLITDTRAGSPNKLLHADCDA